MNDIRRVAEFGRRRRASYTDDCARDVPSETESLTRLLDRMERNESPRPLFNYPPPPEPEGGARVIADARLMEVNLLLDGTTGFAFRVVAERPKRQQPPAPPSAPQPKPGTPRERDPRVTRQPSQPKPGEQAGPSPNRQVRPK